MLLTLLFIMVLIYLMDPNKDFGYFFSMLLIVLYILLSYGVGTDFFSYEFIYKYTSSDYFDKNIASAIEPLFLIFMKLFQNNDIPYFYFSKTISVIIFLITSFWIYGNSNHKLFSLMLYFSWFFLVWTMSAYRQGIVLAIGILLFFDKKRENSLFKSITCILLLSLIHKSALVYLLLILLQRKLKFDKNMQIKFLLISLIFSLLPIYKLFVYLPSHKIFDRLITYTRAEVGFFDLASLMRIFLFIIVISHYDILTSTKYFKKLTDSFLFGVSLYFMLKFSEIVASRSTIYSFILIVIILPEIINSYKLSRLTVVSLTFIISLFMLTKEVTAYKQQVGYDRIKLYSTDMIYDYDPNHFNNYYVKVLYQ